MDLISALQFLRLNDVPEGKTLLSVVEMWFTEHPAVCQTWLLTELFPGSLSREMYREATLV